MAEWVKVANMGSELALVGDKYLFPGERREVLREHFETAKGRYPQVVEITTSALPTIDSPKEKKMEENGQKTGLPFTGQIFVLAGSFEAARAVLVEQIQAMGGIVEAELSARTHYLVAGKNSDRKAAKAEKFGAIIISEQELTSLGAMKE